jgi:FemAB-related protein (PEP-CTERM system-associated)
VLVRPVLQAEDVAAWERYVASAPGATVFHDPAWCAAVAACFGQRPRHGLAWQGARVVGVLPLMEVDSLLGGRLHVSVPYGTYGGILADDDRGLAALAKAAVEDADARGAQVLDFRSADAAVPGLEHVTGYVGFARPLPDHPNDVPATLPKRARAAARHARDRSGVTIQHDRRMLRSTWELYSRSMRRIASINYPYSFFEELAGRFGERLWASVAWCDGRPVAGTVSFVFGDTLMPYVLGVDERVRCDGATNLLYWSVMELAVRAGLRNFDFGRSRADNAGAVGFKKNQGFDPRPLGYQRYVPAGRRAPDLRPSNPRFALARRAWRHLPLAVTRALGARLARWLPG